MSLRAYSLGLLAFMLIKVLAPGYFSRQDTKTPVKIGIWAMVANMAFNLALIRAVGPCRLGVGDLSVGVFECRVCCLRGLLKAMEVLRWQSGLVALRGSVAGWPTWFDGGVDPVVSYFWRRRTVVAVARPGIELWRWRSACRVGGGCLSG